MSDHVVGLGDIARYFSVPSRHADDDHAHVSKDELAAARGRISRPADAVIDAIASDDSNYDLLRELQREGWFNDRQVSLRDLHAAARGTGHAGESIAAPHQTLLARLRETSENLAWLSRNREAVNALNTAFSRAADGPSYARAVLAAGSELTETPIEHLNTLFGARSEASYARAALANGAALLPAHGPTIDALFTGIGEGPTYSRSVLAVAAATTPRDTQELAAIYRDAPGPSYTRALLALAAATSPRPMSPADITRIYESTPSDKPSYSRAILVLAAVASGKDITQVNALFANARNSYPSYTNAMLALGAATTNTSMADMNRFITHAAPGSPSYSRAQLAIAMAARASGTRPHPGVAVVLSAIADEITSD